jgi:hypothetical protein
MNKSTALLKLFIKSMRLLLISSDRLENAPEMENPLIGEQLR